MDPARSHPSERQWEEHEVVYMFTEILQQARDRSYSPTIPHSASQILFDNIQRFNIQPNWDDLILPNGRSTNSCRTMFTHFERRSAPPPVTSAVPPSLTLPPPDSLARKRPISEILAPSPGGRILKPKPTQYAEPARLSLPGSSMFPLSPLGGEAPSLAEPRKKRGRPTKKEQEERRRQAEEVARRQSLMSPDAQGGQFAVVSMAGSGTVAVPVSASARTPQTYAAATEESNSGSSGGKKRRGRPSKSINTYDPMPPFHLVERTQAYEPPARTSSTRDRRTSVSAKSEPNRIPIDPAAHESAAASSSTGTTTAPAESEERRQTRPRTWNETIL